MTYVMWFACGVLSGGLIAGALLKSLYKPMAKIASVIIAAGERAVRDKSAAREASKELGGLIKEFEKKTSESLRRVSDRPLSAGSVCIYIPDEGRAIPLNEALSVICADWCEDGSYSSQTVLDLADALRSIAN